MARLQLAAITPPVDLQSVHALFTSTLQMAKRAASARRDAISSSNMFGIALSQYRRALDDRSVLDFSDVLQRALDLLRQMDEFSQSRFRLESRYHHVLVDEFQDTSRAQWELVSLLIQSWGEGMGLATEPSIFIVGDRKQSIYRFRDAEVAVMQSMVVFGAACVAFLVCLSIPFLGWILSIFIFYASAALWLILMFKAYQGERFKLPVAGEIAEQRI